MEEVQSSLKEVVASLKVLSDKVESISAKVDSNGTGLTQITKQVDDFGKDLDIVKQAQATAAVATSARPRLPPQADKAPMLANNGPPLLQRRQDAPPDERDLGDLDAADAADSVPRSGLGLEFRLKPPKHQFPTFNGEFPLLWVDLCYNYFDMYNVPVHHWVSTAIMYFEGHAALWLQSYRRLHRRIHWDAFITAVVAEFGCDEFDGQMSKLLQLKQTGTVAEYKLAYESCMYHLLSVDASLSPRWFVSQFVFGLRDDRSSRYH